MTTPQPTQKLTGNNINVRLSGKGNVKLKVSKYLKLWLWENCCYWTNSSALICQVLKAFHLLEPKGSCNKVSINVTVKGKVKYTGEFLSPAAPCITCAANENPQQLCSNLGLHRKHRWKLRLLWWQRLRQRCTIGDGDATLGHWVVRRSHSSQEGRRERLGWQGDGHLQSLCQVRHLHRSIDRDEPCVLKKKRS